MADDFIFYFKSSDGLELKFNGKNIQEAVKKLKIFKTRNNITIKFYYTGWHDSSPIIDEQELY